MYSYIYPQKIYKFYKTIPFCCLVDTALLKIYSLCSNTLKITLHISCKNSFTRKKKNHFVSKLEHNLAISLNISQRNISKIIN